jgi:hemerythrin
MARLVTILPPEPVAYRADDMQLGFAPMDEVHAEFLSAVDALIQAPDESVPPLLAELERHTRGHFEAEERWMDETAFPARKCHADEHAAVLRSVVGVGARVARGDLAAARTLGKALRDWFPAHADYMDAALAHWMCKLRHGGTPVVVRRYQGAMVA